MGWGGKEQVPGGKREGCAPANAHSSGTLGTAKVDPQLPEPRGRANHKAPKTHPSTRARTHTHTKVARDD